MKRNDKALVSSKPCPHCAGAGSIPCTGREYHQKVSIDWADGLHGEVVAIPFWLGEEKGWTKVPGLAIKTIIRGGWGALKIYVSIDKAPYWGGYRHILRKFYGYDEDYDVINGRKLYYIIKGRPSRKDIEVIPMSEVMPELKEIVLLTIK